MSNQKEKEKYIFSDKDKWALQQFEELTAVEGSRNLACKKVGISSSIMTQIIGNKYPGNTKTQMDKLISYFDTKTKAKAKPAMQTKGGYVDTHISSDIYSIIENCKINGDLAAIGGDAGVGKTMAAMQFVKDNPYDCIFITANPIFNLPRDVLEMIADELNVSGRTGRILWKNILGKLRDGMVLIVDEAQCLKGRTLDTLRGFSDYFKKNGQTFGIVFIGNMETLDSFDGSVKAQFAQIANRTRQKKTYRTKDVKREDIKKLCPLALEDEKQISFLYEIAKTAQGIRGAVNLYTNTVDARELNYDGLVAAAKHMEMRI